MTCIDTPVAPTGCPFALSPPDGLIGRRPSFSVMPSVGFRGVGSASCDQGGDERTEQGFAATACVVHELEEPEIEWQLLLRETPVRTEPGAQEGPEPFHGVDVHLAEAIPVLVAGVFAAPVANRLVPVAPVLQAGVDA